MAMTATPSPAPAWPPILSPSEQRACCNRFVRCAWAQDEQTAGMVKYNKRVSSNPRLTSLALAMDEDFTDGFTIAVVLPEER